MRTRKYLPGIAIAKAVIGGDYQRAYILRSLLGNRGYTVAEARAITGASRVAQARYGAPAFVL
jgi:hypothetical protein